MTAQDIADKLSGSSLDVPGVLRGEVERQVRAVGGLAQTAHGCERIACAALADGRQIKSAMWRGFTRLSMPTQLRAGEVIISAIRPTIQRTKNGDAFDMTDAVRAHIAETLPTLPPTLKVEIFDVNADKIRQRINVHGKWAGRHGAGFVYFVSVFERTHCLWVAAGIPASLMATFGVMLYLDMTINMLSLFALIMTIGIIVDDAIVVGEWHSATLTERGERCTNRRGGWGVTHDDADYCRCALTTLAAFIPMLLITAMGQFVRAIPPVLFSVLVASLIERFFVPARPFESRVETPAQRTARYSQGRFRAVRAFPR